MLVSSLVLTKIDKSNKNKRTQRAQLPLKGKGNLLMSACFSYNTIVSGYYDVIVTSQVAVLKK